MTEGTVEFHGTANVASDKCFKLCSDLFDLTINFNQMARYTAPVFVTRSVELINDVKLFA